jgi:hypothetical protein
MTKEEFIAAVVSTSGDCPLSRLSNETEVRKLGGLMNTAKRLGLSETMAWGIMSGWDYGHEHWPSGPMFDNGVDKDSTDYKLGVEWGNDAFIACGYTR